MSSTLTLGNVIWRCNVGFGSVCDMASQDAQGHALFVVWVLAQLRQCREHAVGTRATSGGGMSQACLVLLGEVKLHCGALIPNPVSGSFH